MASSASLPIISGGLSISTSLSSSSSNHHSSTVFKWGLRRDQDTKLFTRRTKGQAVRLLANPNVCITQGFHMYNADIFGLNMLKDFFRVTPRKAEKKEVIMVDPLEAKRLAAKQMAEIKEKERLKRRREIEAINGAWAMIGLTAGLVIEGHTGNSILSQSIFSCLFNLESLPPGLVAWWRKLPIPQPRNQGRFLGGAFEITPCEQCLYSSRSLASAAAWGCPPLVPWWWVLHLVGVNS
ncbi:unnamed protein product [Camellia sinensis]